MTVPESTPEAIEARAERLAQAREHWHCADCGEEPPLFVDRCAHDGGMRRCTDDHRTPAEQRDAALDAAAVLWAYFAGQVGWPSILRKTYAAIQRTEGPQ